MPAIFTSFAPGIALAVASPPSGLDQRVGLAVDHERRGGHVRERRGAVARGHDRR